MEETDLQQKIISIAKALMETHYTLDTHTLYLKSVRILNSVDKRHIEDAINILLKKKILFSGKALANDDILKNATRKMIWTIILDLPGIYFSMIKRFAGKGSGEIEWHLYILQRYGYIRQKTINEKKRYFNFYSDKELDKVYAILHQSKIIDTWRIIEKNPEISMKRLSKLLDIPITTLSNKVHIMVNTGILNMGTGLNNNMILTIYPKFREEITKFFFKLSEYISQLSLTQH